MAKRRTYIDRMSQTPQQRNARRNDKPGVHTCSPRNARITSERYPKMSPAALAFARQMRANPHVTAVMRDLAAK
jgi:hypothetical protein